MTVPILTVDHLYLCGLPRGSLAPRAEQVTIVDAATGTLALPGHGLSDLDQLELLASGNTTNGAPTPALPAPLSTSTVYYALPVAGSDNLFRVALTQGGAAVAPFTTTPVGLTTIKVSNARKIAMALAVGTGVIYDAATAHEEPWTTVPEHVIAVGARWAGYELVRMLSLLSGEFKTGASLLMESRTEDKETVERWRAGRVVRGVVDAAPTAPRTGARSWAAPDRGLYEDGGDFT